MLAILQKHDQSCTQLPCPIIRALHTFSSNVVTQLVRHSRIRTSVIQIPIISVAKLVSTPSIFSDYYIYSVPTNSVNGNIDQQNCSLSKICQGLSNFWPPFPYPHQPNRFFSYLAIMLPSWDHETITEICLEKYNYHHQGRWMMTNQHQ